MTAATIVAIAALVIAVIAYAYARRLARKLAVLEEMYWQLKFEHGELKAKVDASSPARPEAQANFIPLVQLRPPSPQASAGQAPSEPDSRKQ
jgi:hypothetical protein